MSSCCNMFYEMIELLVSMCVTVLPRSDMYFLIFYSLFDGDNSIFWDPSKPYDGLLEGGIGDTKLLLAINNDTSIFYSHH